MTVQILIGDVLARLAELPSEYFDTVITSPPYWGLRDYDVDGQIGLEPSLGEHIAVLVRVFREVRRVLKRHGTFWLNYGDCYAAAPNGKSAAAYKADGDDDRTFRDKPFSTVGPIDGRTYYGDQGGSRGVGRDFHDHKRAKAGPILDLTGGASGGGVRGSNKGNTRATPQGRVVAGGYLKPKDLCMIANRLAIALQDDGWWIRSEIIWHKPNPMPESVYDRPTSAHEKIWLLTKSEDYFYNHMAVREPVTGGTKPRRPAASDTGVGWGRLDRLDPDQPDRGRDRIVGRNGGPKIATAEANGVDRGKRARFGTMSDLPAISRSGNLERKSRETNGGFAGRNSAQAYGVPWEGQTRNARNVWKIAPKAFREAHFATFPPALVERCLLAGAPPDTCSLCGLVQDPADCGGMCAILPRSPGRVLDPFGGAGTVGLVAQRMGLDCTLIELNPEYAEIARQRIDHDRKGPGDAREQAAPENTALATENGRGDPSEVGR